MGQEIYFYLKKVDLKVKRNLLIIILFKLQHIQRMQLIITSASIAFIKWVYCANFTVYDSL